MLTAKEANEIAKDGVNTSKLTTVVEEVRNNIGKRAEQGFFDTDLIVTNFPKLILSHLMDTLDIAKFQFSLYAPYSEDVDDRVLRIDWSFGKKTSLSYLGETIIRTNLKNKTVEFKLRDNRSSTITIPVSLLDKIEDGESNIGKGYIGTKEIEFVTKFTETNFKYYTITSHSFGENYNPSVDLTREDVTKILNLCSHL